MYNRHCRHFGELNRNVHNNKHLQNAWNKYGEESFEFNVLEYCDVELLNEREKYWINHFKSTDSKYGYNIRIDPFTNRGLKWSETQREKMYESINKEGSWYRNHSIPQQTLEKAWEASRNRIWTDEERKRQSIILTGTKVLDTSKMKIAQTGENNGSAKLKENEVKEIIYLLDNGYDRHFIASIYKVSYSNINAIYSKRSWNFIDRNSIKDDKIFIKNAKKKVQMYD